MCQSLRSLSLLQNEKKPVASKSSAILISSNDEAIVFFKGHFSKMLPNKKERKNKK